MNIIQMSLDASILLISVLFIRLLFVNKIPKVTLLILWGIVALKLIIPYSFYSKLHLQPMMQSLFNIMPAKELGNTQDAIEIQHQSNIIYHHVMLTLKSDVALSIWFVGALMVSLFFIVFYVRSYKEFQTAIPVKNNVYLNKWLQDNKLKRTVQIAVSDKITAPLTYKLIKPVIIFPKSTDWHDERSLQFVLAHEYVHIKRLDILWKMLLIVILALHWFNPLVWIMFYIVNRDIELSCDEKVIRQLGVGAKSEYALALIHMAEKSQKMTPLCNNFSKNGIEERIVSIMKLKKTSILGVALASTFVLGGVTIFAATGQASEAPKEASKQVEITKDLKLEMNVQNEAGINDEGKSATGQSKVEINGKEVKDDISNIVLVKTEDGAIAIEGESGIYKNQ